MPATDESKLEPDPPGGFKMSAAPVTSPRQTTRRHEEASNLGRSILGGLQRRRSSTQPTFTTRARPFGCALDRLRGDAPGRRSIFGEQEMFERRVSGGRALEQVVAGVIRGERVQARHRPPPVFLPKYMQSRNSMFQISVRSRARAPGGCRAALIGSPSARLSFSASSLRQTCQ